MKQQSPLTNRKYAVPLALVTLLFFLWGFARAILDVLNKHLQNQMDITVTRSSLIQVTTYLGYFLMAIPAGMFINRFGYRRGVVLGLLVFGVGSLLFIPGVWAGTFGMFLAALFVIGCGLVFLETAANPYVTELGPAETAMSRLNLSQSVNGLGCLFATFAVGQWFFTSNSISSVVLPYALMGVAVLIVALVFTRVELPEINHEEGESETLSGNRIAELLLHRHLFSFGLLALLCYEVAEISINSYFINFVTAQGWMDDTAASVVITCALAVFMVGRFAGSWVMRRMPAVTMLLVCGVGSVVCIGVVLANVGRVSMVALIANYLFEAIMFPTIFALSLRGLGGYTKTASSLLMMTPVGGCGFLLMSLIADCANIVVPFVVPLVGFVVVTTYAFCLWRRDRRDYRNAVL